MGYECKYARGERGGVMRVEQHDQQRTGDADSALPNQQTHTTISHPPRQHQHRDAKLGPQEKADRVPGAIKPSFTNFPNAIWFSNDLPPFVVIGIELGVLELHGRPDVLPHELRNGEMAFDVEDAWETEGISGSPPVVVGIKRQAQYTNHTKGKQHEMNAFLPIGVFVSEKPKCERDRHGKTESESLERPAVGQQSCADA